MTPPISDQLRSRYDAIPYISSAFPQSHPDNLKTMAALAGIASPDVTNCRVLELGCAAGGNLAPMAQTLPGGTFLGIDFSTQQLAAGLKIVGLAGLRNIELRCQNLLEFNDADRFDYIIAHGLYSWVPSEVRDKLMQICATRLSPQGIAYISFNTLPGWHTKRIARDMMLYHSRKAAQDSDRAPMARAMLDLAKGAAVAPSAYRAAIQEANDRLSKETDWSLVHDDMELVNEPVYLEQFVKHAAARGLRYLGVASQNMEQFYLLPADVQKKILEVSKSDIERDQYSDFLCGRAYRDAILCRADTAGGGPAGTAALSQMYVASNLTEENLEASDSKDSTRFVHSSMNRSLTVKDPGVIAAFRSAKEYWPRAIPFAEMINAATAIDPSRDLATLTNTISDHVMYAYKTSLLELWTRPLSFLDITPQRPVSTPLARIQLGANLPLVVFLRDAWFTPDATMLKFLPLLDGTRGHSELIQEAAGMMRRGELSVRAPDGAPITEDKLGDYIAAMLKSLAAASFLWKQSD